MMEFQLDIRRDTKTQGDRQRPFWKVGHRDPTGVGATQTPRRQRLTWRRDSCVEDEPYHG